MNTQEKGEIAVAKVIVRAAEKMITVSIPMKESRYDLVLDVNNKLYRVQVKYGNGKARGKCGSKDTVVVGACSYPGRKSNKAKHYTDSEIDAFLVYLPRIDEVCWFEPSFVDGKKELYLHLGEPKKGYKQTLARDYIW